MHPKSIGFRGEKHFFFRNFFYLMNANIKKQFYLPQKYTFFHHNHDHLVLYNFKKIGVLRNFRKLFFILFLLQLQTYIYMFLTSLISNLPISDPVDS